MLRLCKLYISAHCSLSILIFFIFFITGAAGRVISPVLYLPLSNKEEDSNCKPSLKSEAVWFLLCISMQCMQSVILLNLPWFLHVLCATSGETCRNSSCATRGQSTCPNGHLSKTYRHMVRVRVRVRMKFGNLHNSISDKRPVTMQLYNMLHANTVAMPLCCLHVLYKPVFSIRPCYLINTPFTSTLYTTYILSYNVIYSFTK